MILLDTNVISALMAREATVVNWLDQQPQESVWLTSITVFESEFGLALLPPGKRRKALELAFASLVSQDLDGRVVSFDRAAASAAAQLAAQRQRAGRTVDMRGTQIAGIAMVRRATLAARNRRHFDDLPTPVVNPWDQQRPRGGCHPGRDPPCDPGAAAGQTRQQAGNAVQRDRFRQRQLQAGLAGACVGADPR